MKMFVLPFLFGLLLSSAGSLPVPTSDGDLPLQMTFPLDSPREISKSLDKVKISNSTESTLTADCATNDYQFNVTDRVNTMDNITGNCTTGSNIQGENVASRMKRDLQNEELTSNYNETTAGALLNDFTTTPNSIFGEADSVNHEGLIDPKILKNVINMANIAINNAKLSKEELDFSKIFIRIVLQGNATLENLDPQISNPELLDHIIRNTNFSLQQQKEIMRVVLTLNKAKETIDISNYVSLNISVPGIDDSTSDDLVDSYNVSSDEEIYSSTILPTELPDEFTSNYDNETTERAFLNDITITPSNAFVETDSVNDEGLKNIMKNVIDMTNFAINDAGISEDDLDLYNIYITIVLQGNDTLEKLDWKSSHPKLLENIRNTNFSLQQQTEIMRVVLTMNKAKETIDISNDVSLGFFILEKNETVSVNDNSPSGDMLDSYNESTIPPTESPIETIDFDVNEIEFDEMENRANQTIPIETQVEEEPKTTETVLSTLIEESTIGMMPIIEEVTSSYLGIESSTMRNPDVFPTETFQEYVTDETSTLESSSLEYTTSKYVTTDEPMEYLTTEIPIETSVTIENSIIESGTTVMPIMESFLPEDQSVDYSTTEITTVETFITEPQIVKYATTEVPTAEFFMPELQSVEYSTSEIPNMISSMPTSQSVKSATTEISTMESFIPEPRLIEPQTTEISAVESSTPGIPTVESFIPNRHSAEYSTTELSTVESSMPEPHLIESATTEIPTVEFSIPQIQSTTTDMPHVESSMPERQSGVYSSTERPNVVSFIPESKSVESTTTEISSVTNLKSTLNHSYDANHDNVLFENFTARQPKFLQIIDSDLLGNETVPKNETTLQAEVDFIQLTKNYFMTLTTTQMVTYIVAFSLTILICTIFLLVKCRGAKLIMCNSKYRHALDQDAIGGSSNVVFGSIQRLNSSIPLEDDRPSRPPSFIPLEPMFPDLAHNMNGAMLLSSFSKSKITSPLAEDQTDSNATPGPHATCNDIMDFESDISIADKSQTQEKPTTPENVCENTLNENSEMKQSEQETDEATKPTKPSRVKNVTIISITTTGSDIIMKHECSNYSESEKSVSGPSSVRMSRESLSSDDRSTLPIEEVLSSGDGLEKNDSVQEPSSGPKEIFSIRL